MGGALSSFYFTNVPPSSVPGVTFGVTAGQYNPPTYDTVLLNVCSPLMDCTPDTLALYPGAEAALGTFVGNGGKLIIYDGECGDVTPVNYYLPVNNYNWLPAGFGMTTGYAPPAAPGAPNNTKGPITVDEDNILSSNSPSGTFGPYYIDAAGMTQNSEVRDASYMTTHDSNWCVDMSVTKESGLVGWTHAYARYQSGLMIYNGLDRDVFLPTWPTGGNELTPPLPNGVLKMWLQELQAPLSPTVAELPCVPTPPVTTCSITINKNSNPAGGTGFVFHSLLPALDNITLNGGQGVSVLVPCGFNLEVYEAPTPGWTLTNITCAFTNTGLTGSFNVMSSLNNDAGFQAGDDTVGFAMYAGAHLECTFTNTGACAAPGGLDISTGTGTLNSLDPKWQLTSAPSGALTAYPRTVADLEPVTWIGSPSGSKWIHRNDDAESSGDVAGDYSYSMPFSVPAGTSKIVVDFDAADDDTGFVVLDSNPASTSFSIPGATAVGRTALSHGHLELSPAPGGAYAVHAVVNNSVGPTGFLLHGTVTCLNNTAASVGGVASLTVSSSGSPVPWTPLAAVTTSGALAMLAAGVWYSRRRSLP